MPENSRQDATTPLDRAFAELDRNCQRRGSWRWDNSQPPFTREGLEHAYRVLRAATPKRRRDQVEWALLDVLKAVDADVAYPMPLNYAFSAAGTNEHDRAAVRAEKRRVRALQERATNVRAVLEYIGTPDEVICDYGRRGLILKSTPHYAVKQAVLERDGERCVHCGLPGEHFHHVNWTIAMRPLPEDLEWTCAACNHAFERKEFPEEELVARAAWATRRRAQGSSEG